MTRKIFLMSFLLLYVTILPANDISKEKAPVVFIHGILGNPAVFWKMKLRFEKDGFICYNYGYKSTTKTIEEHGEEFSNWITKTFKGKPFYLISHSMGNLVAREAVATDSSIHIVRWVMLAPPNQGAQIADILNNIKLYGWITGEAGQDLLYSQKQHFMSLGTPPFEFGIIAGGLGDNKGYNPLLDGDNDGEVRVSETYLDGSKDHIILQHLHTPMLLFKDTYQQAKYFLLNGQFKR